MPTYYSPPVSAATASGHVTVRRASAVRANTVTAVAIFALRAVLAAIIAAVAGR